MNFTIKQKKIVRKDIFYLYKVYIKQKFIIFRINNLYLLNKNQKKEIR